MAGVQFPTGADDRVSTTATGRAIFADAVRQMDPKLAAQIEHTDDWRSGYVAAVREIVRVAAQSTESALNISTNGLASVHERFIFEREGRQHHLDQAMATFTDPGFGSVWIEGRQLPERELSLPYQGRRLFGDELRRQVDEWVQEGIAEPSFAVAMHTLMDNPDWIDCSDLDFAVIGAAAEMGPTRMLLRMGARIHAVDLPNPVAWQRLIGITRGTAGSLRVPIHLDAHGAAPIVVGGMVHADDDERVALNAGADLIKDTPELRTWLNEIQSSFVLGNYAYADGAVHVLLSVASDAIAQSLLASRSDIALAYLATPTDHFAVPIEVVEESRRRWARRGLGAMLQAPLRVAGQFEPNYPNIQTDASGREFGMNDSVVTQQGPNYILAKRIQRWRAVASRHAGVPVSLNVAPATRTRSVVRSRALAAAYAGAGRFGIEVFEPATASAVMAAMLVHDLRNPKSVANPETPLVNPMDLYASGALHGGLWRSAYTPRSVLGVAAVLGLLDSRG